jgi:hypothetical protein
MSLEVDWRNWRTKSNNKHLSSDGWHIPSSKVWDKLTEYLGGLEDVLGK